MAGDLDIYAAGSNRTAFCSNIRDMMGNATEAAQAEITPSKENKGILGGSRISYHGGNYLNIGSNNNNNYGGSSDRSSGKGNGGALVVGIFAIAGLFVTSIFIGKSLAEYKKGNEGLKRVKEESDSLKDYRVIRNPGTAIETSEKTRIEKVLKVEKEMFGKIYNHALTSLVLKAALAAGLVFIIIGGITAGVATTMTAIAVGENLMIAGCVISVITGLVMAVRFGFNLYDTDTVVARAKKVEKSVEEALASIGRVDTVKAQEGWSARGMLQRVGYVFAIPVAV